MAEGIPALAGGITAFLAAALDTSRRSLVAALWTLLLIKRKGLSGLMKRGGALRRISDNPLVYQGYHFFGEIAKGDDKVHYKLPV
jgi:hypothetical protein